MEQESQCRFDGDLLAAEEFQKDFVMGVNYKTPPQTVSPGEITERRP